MIAILTFIVIFVLLGSGLLLLFYREAMIKRISEVINPKSKQRSLMETIQQTGSSLGGMVEHFEQVLPKSEAEVSVAKQRLVRAGIREDQGIKFLYGAKVLLPLVLLAIAFATGLASKSIFMSFAVAIGGGFLIPDFYLGHLISKRQKAIHRGLPDVLDMLVIQFDVDLAAVRGVGFAFDQPHFLEQRQGRAHGLRLDALGAGEVRGRRRSVLFKAAEDRLLCPGEFPQFRRRIGANAAHEQAQRHRKIFNRGFAAFLSNHD